MSEKDMNEESGEALDDEAEEKAHDNDLVDEAGKESFPASDPPAWNISRP